MTEKLDTLTSGVPNEKSQNICEYVALKCRGAEDEQTFKTMCSVKRGADCYQKVINGSSKSNAIGVLSTW